jgi:hypothetical protein
MPVYLGTAQLGPPGPGYHSISKVQL